MKNLLIFASAFILFSVGNALGQTSWLDRPFNNWNNSNGNVPNAPRTLVPIDPRCQSQVRQPDSLSDRAVTRAGWSLFGAAQSYGPVTLVNAMAGVDGMCRPSLYNAFVFVNNRFAGTLSPTTMESRADGSLISARLNGTNNITADFARYRSTDALCCPSQESMVTYSISSGARPTVRANEVTTTQICQTDGGVSTQDNVVSGTVTYRQRVALPATAVLTVKLVDVSRADAPASTILEQRVETAGKQAPFDFDFAYDRSRINERNRYAVQAEVRDNGRLIYITDTSYPVITQGNPKNVEIVMVPVGGGFGQGGNRANTIRGTVTYRERMALAPNSDVRVWMVDPSAPNGIPVAETTFSTGNRQVPFQFELRYETRDIDRNRNYEVRAEIRSKGAVQFRSRTGTAVNTRGGQDQNDSVEIVVSPATEEAAPITGRSMSLSKFGAGSMRVGDRNQFLVQGGIVISVDGRARVTVGSITNQTEFNGTLVFADNSTLRIAVTGSSNGDASGEIEVSYSDRRLNSITGNNLTLNGQAVDLRF